MNKKGQNSQDIEVGTKVDINPRSDRSRKKTIRGIVSQIHTKDRRHPHGVLVTLENGEIGRVKGVVGKFHEETVEAETVAKEPTAQSVDLAELIRGDETHQVEFKSDILWSANYSAEDIKAHRPQSKELYEYGKATSKIIIAKSLAGFLNSDGGILIVGVRENKENSKNEIIGVEAEFRKLQDQTLDGYRRMIVDLIKDYFPSNIFNHLNQYFEITFETIDAITVCGIRVKKSDKRAFLRLNKADHFFVRTDASTRELFGEEIVEYCETRFG